MAGAGPGAGRAGVCGRSAAPSAVAQPRIAPQAGAPMPAIPPGAAAAAAAGAMVARAMPTLLHLYWGLAAGAVLVALAPGDTAPGFK